MKQLDPKAVWMFFIHNLILVITIGVILYIILISEGVYFWASVTTLLGFLVLAIIVFLWIVARLTYHFIRYELRNEGFRKEEGIIWKKYVTIPYERIQNVDIHRGILARILGLSDLHIQTAGASAVVSRYGGTGVGAEGRLPGLSREIAEELRDELIQRPRQSNNRGL